MFCLLLIRILCVPAFSPEGGLVIVTIIVNDKHLLLGETQEVIFNITSHVRELTFALCKKENKTVMPHQQCDNWLTLLKRVSVQTLHWADSENFSAGGFYGLSHCHESITSLFCLCFSAGENLTEV